MRSTAAAVVPPPPPPPPPRLQNDLYCVKWDVKLYYTIPYYYYYYTQTHSNSRITIHSLKEYGLTSQSINARSVDLEKSLSS